MKTEEGVWERPGDDTVSEMRGRKVKTEERLWERLGSLGGAVGKRSVNSHLRGSPCCLRSGPAVESPSGEPTVAFPRGSPIVLELPVF